MMAHQLLKVQYELDEDTSVEQRAAAFQNISEFYSKPARAFAEILGKADEVAARQEVMATVTESD
jgi:hypothetical protein